MQQLQQFFIAFPYRQHIRRIGQVIVIIASLFYLVGNIWPLFQKGWNFEWHWPFFVIAWGSTFAAVWLGALGWWYTVRILFSSVDFSFWQAAEIHLKSNLAKYLPGYAWQLVGKAYLARRHAIPSRILSLAMILELVTIMGSGAVLAAGATFFVALPQISMLFAGIRGIGAGSLLLLGGLPVGWRWGKKQWDLPSFHWKYYLFAIFSMTVGWICFGFGFWALAASFQSLAWNVLPTFLFAIVGAFSISLAVLFVPGGIGVRESVMTFLLSPLLGPSAAALVATMSRLLLISCEYVSVVVLFPWRTRKTQ
nr:hypothetical protein [Ardenticatena sp.]